jgi:predicted peroxiredoxin
MPTRRDVLSAGAHACTTALAATALPFSVVKDGDPQRFLLIGLAGPEAPARVSLMFIWAVALAEAGHTVRVDLAGDGTNLLQGQLVDTLKAVGLPPFTDLLARVQDHGIPLSVCRACAGARGITDADLEKHRAQYTNGAAMAAAMEWATKVLVI